MIEHDFQEWLKDQAAVATIVAARIYPCRIPQGGALALPAITYQVDDSDSFRHLGGVSTVRSATIRVDSWTSSDLGGQYTSARTLAAAISAALDGYRGAMGDSTIQTTTKQSDEDAPEPEANATDKGLEHVSQAYRLIYV